MTHDGLLFSDLSPEVPALFAPVAPIVVVIWRLLYPFALLRIAINVAVGFHSTGPGVAPPDSPPNDGPDPFGRAAFVAACACLFVCSGFWAFGLGVLAVAAVRRVKRRVPYNSRMFSFFRNRRRRKLLDEPFPPAWLAILGRNVGHYARLSSAEQARLRDHTRVLVAEKEWEGADGLVVTEEMRVTIAAQAALLLLGLGDHDYFARVGSVVVWPGVQEIPDRDEFGEVDDTFPAFVADGQSVYRGPVIVSWEHALAEGRDPTLGHNIVVHEFAHQLDDLDGLANGTPPLADPAHAARWRGVMQAAFDAHRAALARGEEGFFTEHAAENETEFFADAAEAFYCSPHDLRAETPEVYELFAGYFRVDPVRWFPGEE